MTQRTATLGCAPIRPLAVMVAVWMVLACVGPASADDRGSAAHHCGCAERCKGAACCCPSDAPEPAAPEASPPRTNLDSSPCVGRAPCGDPAVPDPASPRTITRLAALTAASHVADVSTSRPLATSDDLRLPRLAPSRLDDPPEPATLA